VSNQQILSFSTTPSAAAAAVDIAEPDPVEGFDGIVGSSPVVNDVLQRVRRVAPTDMPVLITGETGTGKELIARAIHRHSRRALRQFVAINLAAVPETLVAAELFGHERGAFTGADRLRVGRFEAADRGTLFLDEIGELTPDLQVMLLRVLQEGEMERLGGGQTRRVNVRMIAATNRDLQAAMEQGPFREDLFYRLNVFPIHLPPLRDRAEDIPALAECFLRRAAARIGRNFAGVQPSSMRRLQAYHWPGNIRQLQNVIGQCAVLCDDDDLKVPESALAGLTGRGNESDEADGIFDEHLTLEEIKKRYIDHLLTTTRGSILRTAAILNVDRRSLYRMVARYELGKQTPHRRAATLKKADRASAHELEGEEQE
jgi:DNA-binding NtrC family response regulator